VTTLSPATTQASRTATTARLVLADGLVFRGRAFGATGQRVCSVAEVVFNTAMCGYQESLTDPSYTGQILVQTAPLIGNTGVNGEDLESSRVHVAGFVVHELANRHSNFRATGTLSDYLNEAGVLGIEGVDTRALTRHIRVRGAIPGVLTDDASISDAELVERARRAPSMAGANLVPNVGCKAPRGWQESFGPWRWAGSGPARRGQAPVVAVLDCGAKSNILRHLTHRGCTLRVLPHDTPAASLRAMIDSGEAQAVFISNGPGDPAAVTATIATLRDLVRRERPVPMFGICLGHQLLAEAIGAKTFKLPFGHRGANQPVLEVQTGRVAITSQNHGFAVDRASLEEVGGEVTHIHLNDGTVAGFRMPGLPVFSVQYHPEASPGPHDAGPLFDRFLDLIHGSVVGPG
jgi:carbamoyl-phosphate synthase small subunit